MYVHMLNWKPFPPHAPPTHNTHHATPPMLHPLDLVEVLWGVLVGHVGWTDVQLEVWAKVLKVVIVRQLCVSVCMCDRV